MHTRAELKERAKQTMDGQYWKMVVVAIIFLLFIKNTKSFELQYIQKISNFNELSTNFYLYFHPIALIISCFSFIFGLAFRFFVRNPLEVGNYIYYLHAIEKKATFNDLIHIFHGNYLNVVKIMAIRDIKSLLWTLLFIIPGIIKHYEYAMIPYLLAENSALSIEETFQKTKQMMTNNKFNFFILELSFIGWYLLCFVTCGIGMFFLTPYIHCTFTHYYLSLKQYTLDEPDWV